MASRTAAPEAAGHDALLERHDEPLAAGRIEDQLAIERLREPGVDDPDRPALGLEGGRRLQARDDDRPEADEQQVRALAQGLACPIGRIALGSSGGRPKPGSRG